MDPKSNYILEALKMQPLSEEEKAARHILGRLYGPIATCKEKTRNGRGYNKTLWEKALADDLFKEKIGNKSLFLELGHPADREETDMRCVCACIPEMPQIIDGDLYAYVDILDTDNGRLLKTLCDYGFIPGISSRGSGDIMANNEVDPETFFLETWDIVQLPAVKKARLTVCEGIENTQIKLNQALCESYAKASSAGKSAIKEACENLGLEVEGLEEPMEDKDNNIETTESFDELTEGMSLDDFSRLTALAKSKGITKVSELKDYMVKNNFKSADDVLAAFEKEVPKTEDLKEDKALDDAIIAADIAKMEAAEAEDDEEAINELVGESLEEAKKEKLPIITASIHGDGDHILYYIGYNKNKAMKLFNDMKDDWVELGLGGGDTDLAVLEYKGDKADFDKAVADFETGSDDLDFYDYFNEEDCEELDIVFSESLKEAKKDEEEPEAAEDDIEEIEVVEPEGPIEDKKEDKDATASTVGDMIDQFKEYDKDLVVEWAPVKVGDKEYNVIEMSLDDSEDGKILVELSCDESENVPEEAGEDIEEVEEVAEESIDNTSKITECGTAEDNGVAEVMESVKDLVRQNTELENSIKDLKKAKAVGDTKVEELTEELNKYKGAFARTSKVAAEAPELKKEVSRLSEQVTKQAQQITALNESLASAKVNAGANAKKEVKSLTEALSKAETDAEKTQTELKEQVNKYKKQAQDQAKLAEGYKNKCIKMLEHYLSSKANMLGVRVSDIKSLLNERYTLEDIDKACDKLLSEARPVFSIGVKPSVRINESADSKAAKAKKAQAYDPDMGYEIDDSLLELAGLK